MILTPARELAHAQAVLARGSALPPDGLPGVEILDSWVRCMRAGLNPSSKAGVPVVDGADLARRRDAAAVVRRLAQAELETLAQQIAGSNFLLAFVDQQGVILDLYADNRFQMSGADAGIVAGSCWQEAVSGTSGLGTALAAGQPVAVTGLEHYLLNLGAVSCTAAPVRDAQGLVVGVLDASSYFDSRQHHTQALVQMAATHIENGLLVQQLRAHWVLAVHPRAEFLRTLSAGLLVFDGAGRLLARNTRSAHLLQGLDARPGVDFESLFAEPFEHLLSRLLKGGELRLRGALGSVLVAQCINRPPPPRLPASARLAQAPPAPPASARPADPVVDDPAVAEAYRLVAAAVRLKAPILIQRAAAAAPEARLWRRRAPGAGQHRRGRQPHRRGHRAPAGPCLARQLSRVARGADARAAGQRQPAAGAGRCRPPAAGRRRPAQPVGAAAGRCRAGAARVRAQRPQRQPDLTQPGHLAHHRLPSSARGHSRRGDDRAPALNHAPGPQRGRPHRKPWISI